jgi:hypothetical protein
MGAHSRAVKISIVINILTSTVRGRDPTLATYEATRPSLPKARASPSEDAHCSSGARATEGYL